MKKIILNCGVSNWFPRGTARLVESMAGKKWDGEIMLWSDEYPPGSPDHGTCPYAFKYYALKWAREQKYDLALWLDSSCWLQYNPEPIFKKIEKDGWFFIRNGWTSGNWCADSALEPLKITREESFKIPHLMGCCIGLNFNNEKSNQFLDEILECAPKAFPGAWTNDKQQVSKHPDVAGHRHDQTAASVISHRLGMEWQNPQGYISYDPSDTTTIILSQGM